jgi:predicted AlkP superfamily pyrophosphatase or phosphodiesterase
MTSPLAPAYDVTALGALLPGVAASLGRATPLPSIALAPAERVCVVLIDGLGDQLLSDNASDAPFLASLRGSVLRVGCPSTTATSMGSFGTGLPPGRHGLVGYQVMDPDRGVLLNELRWDPAVDPFAWQPYPTIFEHLLSAGVACTAIGNPEFKGSGLTVAALRGPTFVGIEKLHDRVNATVAALAQPGLAYLYWGQVDAAGHVNGLRSRSWLSALREVDEAVARLARLLPTGTLLLVTADHGMIDVPHASRVDLAVRLDLQAGIDVLAGEARFAQAYCIPGAADDVAARLSDAFGSRAWVRTRGQAIAAGWFGAVDDRVRGRIGDVVIAAAGEPFAFVDSRTAAAHELRLIGQHGSLTDAEQVVPLLQFVA